MVDFTKVVKIAKMADAVEAAKTARAAKAGEGAKETTEALEVNTQTSKLNEAFKNSVVRDSQGNPIRVFTGTSKDVDFSTYNVPKNGAWFSEDPSVASQYAVDNDSMDTKFIPWDPERKGPNWVRVNTASRVLPVYLDIRNPKVYENSLEFNDIITKYGGSNYKKGQGILLDRLRLEGYDGVILGKEQGKRIFIVINKSNQIKSAIGNSGKYDLSKKSMIQGAAGAAVVGGTATQEEEVQ